MKKYMGKVVLFAVALAALEGKVHEGRVNELSPSEKYVRIGKEWYLAEKVQVLEELPEPPEKSLKPKVQGLKSKGTKGDKEPAPALSLLSAEKAASETEGGS